MPHAGRTAEIQVAAEMRPQPESQRSDRAIAEWAGRQHGVVTVRQLERLGLSGRAVRHRLASGRLQRLHRGVYTVTPPDRRGRWMAAVLAGGDRAVLSHLSAAALWGVVEVRPGPIDVTLPRATSRSRPGVAFHSGAHLASIDVTAVDGIPCTAVPRTLLDLASAVDGRSLARAIERAETLRCFDLRAVAELVTRNPGHRGARRLTRALDLCRRPEVTRSLAEERFLELLTDAGLPRPEVNAWVPFPEGGGFEPDFLWRRERLVVEVDGREFHATRAAFQRDRARDRRTTRAGFVTCRFTAVEVFEEPMGVAEEVGRLLSHLAWR